MTLQEQTASAVESEQLWRAVMPTVPPPGADQFMMWAGNFTGEQMNRGINGAARKLRAMWNQDRSMTTDDVSRYATSIMTHEMLGIRRHTPRYNS